MLTSIGCLGRNKEFNDKPFTALFKYSNIKTNV